MNWHVSIGVLTLAVFLAAQMFWSNIDPLILLIGLLVVITGGSMAVSKSMKNKWSEDVKTIWISNTIV